MTEAPWVEVQQLAARHDIADFVSGSDAVDEWFREKALANAHTSSTHVCLDDEGVVCGFFALRAVVANVSGLSSNLKRVGDTQGMAPAVLLAWMGLRESHRGGGHGQRLFVRAVQEAVTLYHTARVPLLVVDAINEDLVSWYEKLGLKRIPNSLRLVALLHKIPVPPI